jgi:glycosidase
MKPMFMLAEWSEPELHRSAFDMTYDWELHDVMKDLAKGKADARALQAWAQSAKKNVFPQHAYRMLFTNNHDKNSWDGTDEELFGPAYEAMAVLSYTLPGMPLIYSGQESRLTKRLAFFEKDPIAWETYEMQAFYTEMNALKRNNPALSNGQYGAPLQVLATGNDKVFAFKRSQGGNTVNVAVNVSAQAQSYTLAGGTTQTLAAWRWHISTQH